MLICAADRLKLLDHFSVTLRQTGQEAGVCVQIQTRHHVNSLSEDQGTQLLHQILVNTKFWAVSTATGKRTVQSNSSGFPSWAKWTLAGAVTSSVWTSRILNIHPCAPVQVLINSTFHRGHHEPFFYTSFLWAAIRIYSYKVSEKHKHLLWNIFFRLFSDLFYYSTFYRVS